VAVKSGSEHRRILPPRKDWLAKAVGGKPRKPGRLGLGFAPPVLIEQALAALITQQNEENPP
jgi:hypothetical protein